MAVTAGSTGNRSCGTWQSGFSERMGNQRAWEITIFEECFPVVFGTSPEPRQKDTLQLAENRPNVQVWSWDEPVQYTVQDYNKEKELKRSYQAVYHIMVVVFVSWQMRSCLRFCWEMKEMPRWHCFPLRVLIHCPPCGKGGHAVIITQCLWKMAAVNYWHRRIMADTVFHHKASMRIGMLKQTVVGILFLWQTGKKSVD